ncbi:MAG: hypothetical protein U0Z26_00005, partial [Anaerolineales bacterium]
LGNHEMSALLYKRIQINTRLDSQEVRKRLENVVQAERPWGVFQRGEKPYEGKIEGSYFEISPTITYRNPGKPIIKGNIHTEVNGSSIHISMRLPLLSTLQIIIFICIIGLFSLVIYFVEPASTSITDSPFFLFFGACVFVYVIVLGGFSFETDKSKEFFQKLFETSEIREL